MTAKAALRVALLYALGAALWIVLSDATLTLLWPSLEEASHVGTIKGLAFVGVTGTLLFGLLRQEGEKAKSVAASHAAGVATLLKHFRDFAGKVGDVVLLVNSDGRIVEANEAAADFLGYSRQDLLSRRMKDIEVAGDFSGRPRPPRYESTLITSRRTLRRVTMDVLKLQVRGDAFEQVIAHDADANSRPRQRPGEQPWLETFFDLPFIGIAITSPKSKRWVRFNDRLCEILGYTRAQLENLAWTEVTHPDDVDADVAEFDRVMRGDSSGYQMDKRFVRSDGATVHATIDVRAVRADDGSVDYFIATVQDISDRKLAEIELRREKELLQAIVDNVPVMVIRNRPGGETWWLNRECQSRLGWKNAELADDDFLRGICHDRLQESRARTFFHVANGTWQDFRNVRRDGRHVDVSWTSVRLSDGSSVGIGIDVTERREFERALARQRDLYAAISEINSALLHMPPRDEMLAMACRIAVARGGLKCAWVTELDASRHIARVVARAGDDGGYIQAALAAGEHHPETVLPEHRAARTGAPSVSDPFPGDERLPREFTDLLAAAGIRAMGAFPIRQEGRVAALLNVAAESADFFGAVVFGMLAELSDTVSFALDSQARERERQDALATLEQQESRYRLLFEANPHPMWVYDLDTLRILAVNDAALEQYGYSREAFLERTIKDIRPPDEVERLMRNLDATRSQRGLQDSGTWEHLRKDGSRFRVRVVSHGLDFEGHDARLVMMHDVLPA